MFEFWRSRAFQFRDDALGQDFSEFNAPLVKRVNVPNCALREHTVLVQCHQFAEQRRRQFIGQNRIGRPIAFKYAMRHQRLRRAFGLDLGGGLAKRQRFGLREDIRQQYIVMPAQRRQAPGQTQ